MRVGLVRPQLWFAAVILGLTLAGACNLNPQPLPPGSNDTAAGDDASFMGTTGAPSDAGKVAQPDATGEEGGLPVFVSGTDAGRATDGSADGAPNDAALDGPPPGDAGCAAPPDCGCACDARDAAGE